MARDGQFSGKVAVVTGGGSGIGEADSMALAADGASVVIADIDPKGAQRVADAIGSARGAAAVVKANVGDAADIEAMVKYAVDTLGGLDLAVNNAGIGRESNPTGSYSL